MPYTLASQYRIPNVALVALTVSASMSHAQELSPDEIRAAIRRAGGPKAVVANMSDAAAKAAGRMIDDHAQVTGAAAIDLISVTYVKLVGIERRSIPDLEVTKAAAARGNALSVCTAPIARILIGEHGVAYRYMVYSNSGEYLFQYEYNAASCAAYLKR